MSEALREDVRKQKNKWDLNILLFLPLEEWEWGQKEDGKGTQTVTYIYANMYAITLYMLCSGPMLWQVNNTIYLFGTKNGNFLLLATFYFHHLADAFVQSDIRHRTQGL